MGIPTALHLNRDIEDLGKLLSALFEEEGEPAELVRKYMTSDLKRLRSDFHERTVSIAQMTPNLRFLPSAPVMSGGSGVVFQVVHASIPSLKYALKIPRPSLIKVTGSLADADEANARTRTEYLKHTPLSHRNIARVFTAGNVKMLYATSTELSSMAVLMEWVNGAKPLIDYLLSKEPSHLNIVALLTDCFLALDHLHANKLIHWDMKSDNFLVSSDGIAKLMDIGNARRIDDIGRSNTAFSSRWNLPPRLLPAGHESSTLYSSRLFPVQLPDISWDSPWVDLWMLALELNRIFAAVPEFDTLDEERNVQIRINSTPCSVAEVAAHRHVFLSACFPVDDDDATFSLASVRLVLRRILEQSGIDSAGYYVSARDVAQDLEKLAPEFGSAQSIPELLAVPRRVLRLPTTGNAPFSSRIGRLYNSSAMTRLRQHLQLGTLFHVYPGASHRRSEHVAGVLYTVTQYVRSLFADRTNPFWRLAIEPGDVEALLVAAILHDLGHMAYGHFLEELGGLFWGRAHEDYLALVLDPRPTSVHARGVNFGVVGQAAAEGDRAMLLKLIAQDWATGPSAAMTFLESVAEILQPLPSPSPQPDRAAQFVRSTCDTIKRQILHSIMDSAIDADKLDYLIRDAHHCGVKYAQGIDIDRFYQSLTTITDLSAFRSPPGGGVNESLAPPKACLAVTRKGLLPVESILLARYQMFSSVYWHKTARAETAMLQLSVMEYIGADSNRIEERLEHLMEAFRNHSDEEALRWLKTAIEHDPKVRKQLKGILVDATNAVLGDRDKLYRTVFQLHYEPAHAGGSPEAVYRALLKITEKREGAKAPMEFIAQARAIRERFRIKLTEKLGVRFLNGEVLVDIPPASKDQIGNVLVYTETRPRTIQELSPIADAVRDMFTYWARPMRIFMAPIALERAEKRGSGRAAIRTACWQIVQDIEQEEEGQLKLAFAGDGHSE